MASIATNEAPTDQAPQEGGADSAPGSGEQPAGEEVESNFTEITATFDDMDLKEDLLRGIYAYGFEKVRNNILFRFLLQRIQTNSTYFHDVFLKIIHSPSMRLTISKQKRKTNIFFLFLSLPHFI